MNDRQFDDFVNDRLKEYAAPVPAGLWEKVAEGQFDQFVGSKLTEHTAPVSEGLWDKISDNLFDNFVADKIDDHSAPVSEGLWAKIADGKFDSFVSEKVRDYEAPVPAGLWEKVTPEEKDNDRVGFFWFRYPAAAILIVALLTGGYLYFTKEKTIAPEVTTVSTAQKTTGPNTTPVVSQNNLPENSQPSNTISTEKKDDNANKNSAQSSPAVGSNSEINSTKNLHEQVISPSKNNNDLSVFQKNNNALSSNIKPGNRLTPPVNNTSELLTNGQDLINKQSGIATNADDVTAMNDDSFTPSPYQPNFSSASLAPVSSYDAFDLTNKQLSTRNHTNQYKSVIICPADKGVNRDWFLEVYASPDIAIKSVTNVSATPLYMAKKDSSEQMRMGYSAGIRLVKPITDNILLKAGVQYSQANERYVYRTENEVKTTTVVTVRTIIRAPGDTVIVNDTSTLQTIGFKNNTVKNRYRSFDIPVTVGYQFGNDDLTFGINAGVAINLSSWYQGVILDSTLANVTLNKTGNSVYKTNIGVGLIGSISVVKRLSDDMHLFFEPYFRYNLSNMTTPQASFNQRLSVGGLQVGLRFNLNRQ